MTWLNYLNHFLWNSDNVFSFQIWFIQWACFLKLVYRCLCLYISTTVIRWFVFRNSQMKKSREKWLLNRKHTTLTDHEMMSWTVRYCIFYSWISIFSLQLAGTVSTTSHCHSGSRELVPRPGHILSWNNFYGNSLPRNVHFTIGSALRRSKPVTGSGKVRLS